MIQIIKDPGDCPTILTNQGKEQTRKDCRAFKRASKKYLSGVKEFQDFKYYSRPSVKKALMKSHANKCCYCEQWRRQSELAVEHFRPRTAVRQTKAGDRIYPGYFWLAYVWDNLYLSCAECNGRFKSCYFPLTDPKKRARSCEDNVLNERPLLINPGFDNPRKHIYFRMDKICSKTTKGRRTIEFIQLDEENLRKAREKKIGILQSLLDLIQLSEEKDDEQWKEKGNRARQQLAEAVLPTAEFSSMAQDFLRYSGYS
jgi:uncharacterized protein (TIGR02646 family)